jgi:hypothetical protein
MTLYEQIENTKSLLLDLLDDAGVGIQTLVDLEAIIDQTLETTREA